MAFRHLTGRGVCSRPHELLLGLPHRPRKLPGLLAVNTHPHVSPRDPGLRFVSLDRPFLGVWCKCRWNEHLSAADCTIFTVTLCPVRGAREVRGRLAAPATSAESADGVRMKLRCELDLQAIPPASLPLCTPLHAPSSATRMLIRTRGLAFTEPVSSPLFLIPPAGWGFLSGVRSRSEPPPCCFPPWRRGMKSSLTWNWTPWGEVALRGLCCPQELWGQTVWSRQSLSGSRGGAESFTLPHPG